MSWQRVQAGADVLSQFAKKKPVDAVAELIWNSLDAEATEVEVNLETASLSDPTDGAAHVVAITVNDNGHGISPQIAESAFTVLGNSWKRGLNGRSLHNLRPLHGQEGRGRFYAYSLGYLARWTSVSQPEEPSQNLRIEISGDSTRIEGFEISEAIGTDQPTGTSMKITVEQGRPLSALLHEDVYSQLAGIFAPHLLYNPDLVVKFNGMKIDPRPFIVGEPIDIPFELDAPEVFELTGRPVLTLVDWNDEMRTAPGAVLCTADGASLLELEKTAPAGNVRSTAYIRWSGWATTGADLLMVRTQHPEIINWAIDMLKEHVANRSAAIQVSIIEELKRTNAYPYLDEITDPLEVAERDIFDLVAVTARSALRSPNRRQVSMTTRLLKVALQERPEELDTILEEALNLTREERHDLAQLLLHSPLSAIIGAASEVTKRLDLLAGLRHFNYDPDVSPKFREVDQLHPLIKDNTWLFGEPWQLTASERSLRTIIRSVFDDEVLLEDELEAFLAEQPEGDRRRVDLLLQRTHHGPEDVNHRLVVELKRPSEKLGIDEAQQITGYANRLSNHPGLGSSSWTFILIGSEIKDELRPQLSQPDRKRGEFMRGDGFSVYVTTWGELIDDCESRYRFYRDQLRSSATFDNSVSQMRERYGHLLPESPAES
jgi:signal transduction histidine kinase